MTARSKWIDAPTISDVQLLAQERGYAVRVDKEGFHVLNINTGASKIVGCADDAIEIVCTRSL